ncbi:hypothetical protein [Dyadobacter sp. 676]|uniref:DUF4249 family protein n=1 Tax=Dyadobacter sp. 676 TaxID=3088362 RepID=A0AAU8FHP2_9BACT
MFGATSGRLAICENIGQRIRTAIGTVSLLAALTSCNDFRPVPLPITRYIEIPDANRDTMVVISNDDQYSLARLTFEETLSDTAIVEFSTDNFVKSRMFFLLPARNAPLMSIGGLTGDSLYVKYYPMTRPVTGQVKIGVSFRK